MQQLQVSTLCVQKMHQRAVCRKCIAVFECQVHAEHRALGDDKGVQRLQARLLSQLHTLDSHHLSSCLWGLAVTRCASQPLLESLPPLWLAEHLNKGELEFQASLEDNARILWAVSELRAIPKVRSYVFQAASTISNHQL
jgi:hypothetical protein